MKLSKLMMAFAMCAVTLTGTAQTKVIAHRGYWKCEGSAQNSIASLTKAAEGGQRIRIPLHMQKFLQSKRQVR